MCLYVLICDQLPLCLFCVRISEFQCEKGIIVILDSGYFGHFLSKGKLVISW